MNDELKNAFDYVLAEAELKAQTQKYVFEKMQRQREKRSYPYRRIAAVAACLLFLLFGAGGYVSYFIPTSAISIDVNPSLELDINRFDRVLSVKGYNEDGCTVASALDVRFLKYTDAVKRILEDESMTAYLAKDSEVSITVLGKTVEKQEEMLANVSSCTASLHENVQCSHGDKEEVSKAHESGVSFGKYKAFLELQQLRPEIKIEDVENLSMHEIHEMMQAQQHEERQHAEEKRHAEENHAEEDHVEENLEEETDKEEKETEQHHNHEEEKEGKKSHHKQK